MTGQPAAEVGRERQPAKTVGKRKEARGVRAGRWISAMREIPVHSRPRRLVDWINPTGAKKVHSLIDKVYRRKNLEMAWEMVQANRGSGGVDGQTLEGFAGQLDQQLDRLHRELKENVYRPQPVRQVHLPRGRPRRRASQASFAGWESRRFMTGYASRRCSIGWNRFSS